MTASLDDLDLAAVSDAYATLTREVGRLEEASLERPLMESEREELAGLVRALVALRESRAKIPTTYKDSSGNAILAEGRPPLALPPPSARRVPVDVDIDEEA